MSLTLSDHASAIRAKLVEIKDTSQIAHSLLTDSSLTTVMGSSGNKGFRKEQQRLDAVQNDADIISALAPLSDNSAAQREGPPEYSGKMLGSSIQGIQAEYSVGSEK